MVFSKLKGTLLDWTDLAEEYCEKVNNNNNPRPLYLHDHNKVLQDYKSYLKFIIDSF